MPDPQWLQFGLSAAGVIGAGIFIGRVSGEIGERLRLGRAWAGAVLLALATTLPELVATMTVALRGELALALGNILGSITFNLTVLVAVDLCGRGSMYRDVSAKHRSTGWLACGLLGLVILGLALGYLDVGGAEGLGLGHVGFVPLAIFGLYGFGQYRIFRLARGTYKQEARPLGAFWGALPLRAVLLLYAALAAVICVSAYHLGVSAEGLAERYGLAKMFAGATMLGIVTSLPELTNGLTCGRRREYDLVLGNILGANALVCIVLTVADVAIVRGRFFSLVPPIEALSSMTMAAIGLLMLAVVLVGIARRSAARIWRLSVPSLLLVGLYAASLVVSYQFTGGP